jgi:hypothetical protein
MIFEVFPHRWLTATSKPIFVSQLPYGIEPLNHSYEDPAASLRQGSGVGLYKCHDIGFQNRRKAVLNPDMAVEQDI